MTFLVLSILTFFTLFSTTLTQTTKPSLSSPNLSNPSNRKVKKPISFSTRVYSRRRYITRQPSNTSTFSPSKVSLDIHPYPSQAIVMVVGIGSNSTSTPMLTTELLVDTGSSLTWLQASQCTYCYNQGDFPYYDHDASKSYNPVYCFDEMCKSAPARPDVNPDCNDPSSKESCKYEVVYADASSSTGIIGTETFYFHENMHVKFVPFGLGMYNPIPSNFKGSAPGLAGLKRGSGTLLNALGVKKFSHCFPREEEDTGILRFGEEANIMGEKLVLNNDYEGYKASLTNVYVGGERIPVEDGGLPEDIEFDTGTTLTYLSPQVMDAVIASIKVALRRHNPVRHMTWSELCYKTTDMLSGDLDKFAKVTFELGYSTKINMLSFHVWILLDQDSLICLAFMRGSSGENVIGNHSMREVNIGYTIYEDDLAMYFNNQHCRK